MKGSGNGTKEPFPVIAYFRRKILTARDKERQMKEKRSEIKTQSGSFVVHVQYCENATWQGRVVWTEKNKSKRFRSTLELLKLIDSALERGGEAFMNGEEDGWEET